MAATTKPSKNNVVEKHTQCSTFFLINDVRQAKPCQESPRNAKKFMNDYKKLGRSYLFLTWNHAGPSNRDVPIFLPPLRSQSTVLVKHIAQQLKLSRSNFSHECPTWGPDSPQDMSGVFRVTCKNRGGTQMKLFSCRFSLQNCFALGVCVKASMRHVHCKGGREDWQSACCTPNH